MNGSVIVRPMAYVVSWSLAGLLLSVGLVMSFAEADMVLIYYIVGVIAGAAAGLVFAILTRRIANGKTSRSAVLAYSAGACLGGWLVTTAVWMLTRNTWVGTSLADLVLFGVFAVPASLVLGITSSIVDGRLRSR